MHTTGSIARLVGATLVGPSDLVIARLAAVDDADARSLTFVRSKDYAGALAASSAGAALVTAGIEIPGFDTSSRAILYVPSADLAMIKALQAFAPEPEARAPGVHPSASVHPTATIDPSASVGPFCMIGPGAVIERQAVLHGQCTIGRNARIGAGTIVHAHVLVGDRCVVGAGCMLHPGVKIGADGFGYVPAADGPGLMKVPHIGAVEIHDHVEIGANTCIDRAKFGMTVIGAGTKIDNLVQIGHNCSIGRSCIICGQCGLAGSVTLGDGVILGGGVGVRDQLTIGAGAIVGANAGVMGDIPAGERWFGAPAMPAVQAMRAFAGWKRFSEIFERLRELERLSELRAVSNLEGRTTP